MSRAFVNEDDQRETPFVPPRADLPVGFPNYVTPAGMEALLKEKEMLLTERDAHSAADAHDKQTEVSILNSRLQMLENRISSAQVIGREEVKRDKVHFGSIVKLEIGGEKKLQEFQIVGVDEADLKKGKIAFTSPIARLLMNKTIGENVNLKLGKGERMIKIMDIE